MALSLISHTNAGKTTLARTLLQRDIGEVRDAPHVTEFAEDHLLMRTTGGDELRLWDTPGFGDTVRLVQRLQREGTAVGWFLSEVWDRWRDRPFWSSQQALKHVREHADVVLYLVNAAESPEAAAYVRPEMQLLQWMGRPVIVLLNQLGAARSPAEEAADVGRWTRHLQPWPDVRHVMPLDAFARCWVQEAALLAAVAEVLPVSSQAAMAALRETWLAQRLQVFDAATGVLAKTLAEVACARVPLEGGGGAAAALRQVAQRLGRWFGQAEAGADDAVSRAQAQLVTQLDEAVRASTAELIRLHGLQGRAEGEILARVAQQIELAPRVDEGRAALIGGALTGALAGLKADIATGGLTLGGGLLAGGLLGALGAAGLARGLNIVRGGGPPWAGWSAEAMTPIVEAALLRYLAVAHFGRGRGDWAQGEAPAHWQPLVARLLRQRQADWLALWRGRASRLDAPGEAHRLQGPLQALVYASLRDALIQLYPEAVPPAWQMAVQAQAHNRADQSAT
ncbi:MAG: GTPase domain-containing protein [Rubrivivax sp.]|nr:GTPase domain-containing protein [Rubrivivax sp.]